jgi:hypothetical protein
MKKILVSFILISYNVVAQTQNITAFDSILCVGESTTLSAPQFVLGNGVNDIDGNQYNTVIIGSQEWMAENLHTSKYANGDPIPNVTDATQWSNNT